MADAIRIEGLRDAHRSFRQLERLDESQEVKQGLRDGAALVPPAARPLLNSRTGKMAASYRVGVGRDSAFIRSRHPGAGPQEFGGVIRPRGTPITIRPQLAVTRALDSKSDAIVERVGDALDGVFARAGFR